MGLMTALGIGASVVGGILSSRSQNRAADRAADAQIQASRENAALMREIYGRNEENLSGFMDRGNDAGSTINALLGIGVNTAAERRQAERGFNRYQRSTGYQHRLNEGYDALNSGYAGAGVLQSGAAMKGAVRFGQNFASNEFGNYMNMLGNQQGVGLSGASALAGVGQNYANSMAANNNDRAGAIGNAALIQGQNNPFANALGMLGGGLFGMGRGG